MDSAHGPAPVSGREDADRLRPGPAGSLSPSRVADFRACPLRYRFRVVDRLPEPTSTAAVRGTVVHRVLERIFDLPPPTRTPANAEALVEQAWAETLVAEPDVASAFDGPEAVVAWLDGCREVLRRYFTLEDPRRLEPARREEWVETVLDSGLLLRGVVDRIDVAPDGAVRVVDYKTGRAPRVGFEHDALQQLRFYALVLWRAHGVVPAVLRLIYLGGDGETISYSPDEDDLRATERLLDALGRAVREAHESGDWQPNKGWACSYCAHQAICPAYGGTPPPLPPPQAAQDDGSVEG